MIGRGGFLAAVLVLLAAPAAPTWGQPANLWPSVETFAATIDGESVRLALKVYRPPGPGPFPTLVFNHGSTGTGRDPTLFERFGDAPAVARFFVQRGWAVALPQRRGRGGSEGRYEEGFGPNRSNGYSCEPAYSLPGADRALRDIAAAVDHLTTLPYVDRARLLVGGVSRGGILSVAYAGLHPDQVRGVINFVGGWMGTGCTTAAEINRGVFRRGTPFPGESLWLYADNDRFYSLAHSRSNHGAFITAGGRAAWHEFRLGPGIDGHALFAFPESWANAVTAYLQALGLPQDRTFNVEDLLPAPAAPATAFIGHWTGAWDGFLPTRVVVESVTPEGDLIGTYVVRDNETRFRSALSGYALRIQGQRYVVRFWLVGNELHGTFGSVDGDITSAVTMRREARP